MKEFIKRRLRESIYGPKKHPSLSDESLIYISLVTGLVADFDIPTEPIAYDERGIFIKDGVSIIKDILKEKLKLDTENKVAYGMEETAKAIAEKLKLDYQDVMITLGRKLTSWHDYRIQESVSRTLRNRIIETEMRFNDGRFNKGGVNTIYLDDNPIIDFGVGGIGTIAIDGENIPNALYLAGGYNASEQGKGYGRMGINFIFKKLPKIQNIVVQCYDTACPFWEKIGGKKITSQDITGSGKELHTVVINRADFR